MKVSLICRDDLATLAREVGVRLVVHTEQTPSAIRGRKIDFSLAPLSDRYRSWKVVSAEENRPLDRVCGHGHLHFVQRLLDYYEYLPATVVDGAKKMKLTTTWRRYGDSEEYLISTYGSTCSCEFETDAVPDEDGWFEEDKVGHAELTRIDEVREFFATQRAALSPWADAKHLPPIKGSIWELAAQVRLTPGDESCLKVSPASAQCSRDRARCR